VIGGKFGVWKLRGEPTKDEVIQVSQYFDEDGAIPSGESGEPTKKCNMGGNRRISIA
jgi:hypothetical protein